ncbi:hypothetical protein SLS62_003764 [Diatrype stigma]|uniref:Lytic polysaccharide monooxygenase 9 n=1 Tax=Diatrype stigma TaxID=117547 RepID=A0AAN9YTN2_9PEZI
MFFTKTLAASGLLAAANAHMLMKSPTPFPSQNGLNGPLEVDGSNFPCKYSGADTFTGGEVNTYPQGSKQTLSTIGQAVHGGGSCQISITYDTAPTKDSVWKVIHSIEGGCPARNTPGNAGGDASAVAPDTYDFTVPEDLPTGKGVVAWTWLNKVGNREFYMNCGAVEITGSGGSKDAYNALPDMTVLNIMGKDIVGDSSDVKFANPGKSLENNLGSQVYLEVGGAGVGVGIGAGAGSSAAPTTTAAAAPSESAPAGGVFLSVPASSAAPTTAPAAAPTAPAAAPTSAAAAPTTVASPPAAAPTAPAAGSGSGSSGALTGACTVEGTFNCIGGTSFQQCASGAWSAVQPMAAGTQCSAGQSTNMKIAAAGKKRSVRVFRA